MSETITYACVTVPRLNRLKENLPRILPYVDKAVLVFGQRDATAEAYITEINPQFSNKIKLVYREWDDSFANQYTEYLRHIEGGWVLLCDDDELPSDGMLKSIRKYVDESDNGNRYSIVEFKVNPISEGQDLGPANYYRQMLFKWTPQMHYRCHLHQYLVGYYNGRAIRSEQLYYHIKPLKAEYRAACRNYWIGGLWIHGTVDDGVKGPEYWELKRLVSQYHPDVRVFNHLADKIEAGTVHPEIVKWVVRTYYQFETHPHYNEPRAFKDYIFKYSHPEWKEEDYR